MPKVTQLISEESKIHTHSCPSLRPRLSQATTLVLYEAHESPGGVGDTEGWQETTIIKQQWFDLIFPSPCACSLLPRLRRTHPLEPLSYFLRLFISSPSPRPIIYDSRLQPMYFQTTTVHGAVRTDASGVTGWPSRCLPAESPPPAHNRNSATGVA